MATIVKRLTDKVGIEHFLRRNADLHLYELGDLDDFFWPQTTWYGLEAAGELMALLLLYCAPSMLPIVLALSADAHDTEVLRALIRRVDLELPSHFYAHMSPGLEAVFAITRAIESRGLHYKMSLRDPSRLALVDCSSASVLTSSSLAELADFYRVANPNNSFDRRMLETGQYYGLRVANGLVAVAGVHVYSAKYRVAVVGNVATRPDCRGRGYATMVTAAVCRSALPHVDHIGLNVKTDNDPAVACYRRLGFAVMSSYGEFVLRRK